MKIGAGPLKKSSIHKNGLYNKWLAARSKEGDEI
jgi:hypothetical protein